jgi:hypothetical protein
MNIGCPSNTTCNDYPIYDRNGDVIEDVTKVVNEDERIAAIMCKTLVEKRIAHTTAYKSGNKTVFVIISSGMCTFDLSEKKGYDWKCISSIKKELSPALVLNLMNKIRKFKLFAMNVAE